MEEWFYRVIVHEKNLVESRSLMIAKSIYATLKRKCQKGLIPYKLVYANTITDRYKGEISFDVYLLLAPAKEGDDLDKWVLDHPFNWNMAKN